VKSLVGSERALLLWLALLARLMTLPFVDGIVQPDEYFQTLEPGSVLATGHGLLAWEWDTGIRSWALPGLYATLFRIAEALGLDGPGEVVRIAQVIHLGLSLVIVDSSMRLGHVFGGANLARWAGVLAALFPPLLFYATRTLSDCDSTAFLMWGYARWMAEVDQTSHPGAEKARGNGWHSGAFATGLIAGGAYAVRYTAPIFMLGIGLVTVYRRQWKSVLLLVGGFATVAACLGLLDWLTWGSPFHSLLAYFEFNVIDNGAARFGTSPFAWYLSTVGDMLGLAAPLVALLVLRGCLAARSVGLAAAIGFIMISIISHKEERFLLPILALLPLFAALGARRLWADFRLPRVFLPLGACLSLAATWAVYAEKDWSPNAEWLPAMRWLGARDDVSGILATEGWGSLGGHAVHRLPVPVIAHPALLVDFGMRESLGNTLFNYLVISESDLADFSKTSAEHDFVRVARLGRIRVLRRRH